MEVGSVTPLPQSGNPKPRVFRLIEDRGVINRYGFNSAGHGQVMRNLEKVHEDLPLRVPLGVNLGRNKDSSDPKLDYSVGVINLGPFCDYLVVNVSSPNTPGLRQMQMKKELEELMTIVSESRSRIISAKHPKILLKVSPDLSAEEKRNIIAVCKNKKYNIDGLIVGNTTTSRPQSLKSPKSIESGGLSGAPLRELSTQCIKDFYKLSGGSIPIIGCGGISNGRDAYEKIKAGASLIQIYTAIVYQGFPVVGRIKRELLEAMQKDGFRKLEDAVGADHRS